MLETLTPQSPNTARGYEATRNLARSYTKDSELKLVIQIFKEELNYRRLLRASVKYNKKRETSNP